MYIKIFITGGNVMTSGNNVATSSKAKTIYLDSDGYITSIVSGKPNQKLSEKYKYAVIVKEKDNRISVKLIILKDLCVLCKLYEYDLKNMDEYFKSSNSSILENYQIKREEFKQKANSLTLNDNTSRTFTYLVYIMSSTPMLYLNTSTNNSLFTVGLFNNKAFSSYRYVILFEKRHEKLHSLVLIDLIGEFTLTTVSRSLIREYIKDFENANLNFLLYSKKYEPFDLFNKNLGIKRTTFILAYENMKEEFTEI